MQAIKRNTRKWEKVISQLKTGCNVYEVDQLQTIRTISLTLIGRAQLCLASYYATFDWSPSWGSFQLPSRNKNSRKRLPRLEFLVWKWTSGVSIATWLLIVSKIDLFTISDHTAHHISLLHLYRYRCHLLLEVKKVTTRVAKVSWELLLAKDTHSWRRSAQVHGSVRLICEE